MVRKPAVSYGMGFRKMLLLVLIVTSIPFLAISAFVNIRFLSNQQQEAQRVILSMASQAEEQISSHYRTLRNLAQTLSISSVLQKDVLTSTGMPVEWSQINHNILSLRNLINNYLFIEDITGIHFYLPQTMIIPNGSEFLDFESVTNEAWYPGYIHDPSSKTFFTIHAPKDTTGDHGLCFIQPLINPLSYTDITGFIRIDLSPENSLEILRNSLVYDRSSCYLFAANASLLTTCGDTVSGAESLLEEYGQAIPKSISIGKERFYCAALNVSESDMTLVYLTPQSSILSSVLKNCLIQLVLFLVEIILLLTIMTFFGYSILRSRDDRLKLLNYQINPHFLYNTLDMINWKAIDQGNQEIYRPIQELSRFYKITLNHGEDYIRIRDEVEQMRLYLDLQNMRFANSITYAIDVAPELNNVIILHMVLQPILENSIIHGIRETPDQKGHIIITCRQENDSLVFSISDNGIGMDQNAADMLLQQNSQGYGLKSIQDRIQLCYGRKFGIHIQSSIGRGTIVTIRLGILPMRSSQSTVHFNSKTAP